MHFWCSPGNFALFFLCSQGKAHWAPTFSTSSPVESSYGSQLKWGGLLDPDSALVPHLCPSAEVRPLEDWEGRMLTVGVVVESVWKPPSSSKVQERRSGCFRFSQTICFHPSPLGGKVIWWPKRLWFLRADFFGILTVSWIHPIAGEIWTPNVANLFSR